VRENAAWTVALVACAGCIHLGGSAYPLYPNPERQRPPDELVTLQGPIAAVDDQDVSGHGASFALLPGCHVVVLRETIGEGGTSGAWSAHLPRMVYAFRMKHGHRYVIRYRIENTSSEVGRININAFDLAPSGVETAVPLVQSSREILDCRAWGPSSDDA